MQQPRRKTALPILEAAATKHGGGTGGGGGGGSRKSNNLSIFVVVFSIFLFAGFMYNEDVKSIAEFPFASRPTNKPPRNIAKLIQEEIREDRPLSTALRSAGDKPEETQEESSGQQRAIRLPVDKEEAEDQTLDGGEDEEDEDDAEEAVELPPKDCDLFTGDWVFDNVSHPIYKEDECEFLTAQVTCLRNGRKDSLYQNWKWQPRQCSLPK